MRIECLPLGAYQTNCYLVWQEESDSLAVIDPGYSPEVILEKVKELGKTVEAVLLTHGHFDHVGGVRKIADRTGCKVYIHPQEAVLPEDFTAGPLNFTHSYSDGETLEVSGLSLQVLHTPGHTPGSVCLMCGDAVFAGDTLFAGSCGRVDFPGGSWTEMQKSLKRLGSFTKNYKIFPGHGPATDLQTEKQENPYLKGVL